MAITLTLVDSAPEFLKYLCTQDGVSTGSPTTDSTVLLGNAANAVSPDLRTDATAAAAAYGAPSKLAQIAQARLNGYAPIAAGALTQAQARALLNSDDSGNTITARNIATGTMYILPRTQGAGASGASGQTLSPVTWLVDADVDASGDPIVRVATARRPPQASTAYLVIAMRDSIAP